MILLYFYSDWCPPCRFYDKTFITPIENSVGKEYVQRINARKQPQLAEKYNVDKLPMIIFCDENKAEIMRKTGAIDINKVANYIKNTGNAEQQGSDAL